MEMRRTMMAKAMMRRMNGKDEDEEEDGMMMKMRKMRMNEKDEDEEEWEG
jgi:hypothetical protein